MTKFMLANLILLFTLATGVDKSHAEIKNVIVVNAWARASIGTTRPTAAYMVVRNVSNTPMVLKGVITPLAKKSEIHLSTINESGISSMTPAGDIVVPPNDRLVLKPGGYHVMLMGLRKPLIEGESFPLTLQFSNNSSLATNVQIMGLVSRGPESK